MDDNYYLNSYYKYWLRKTSEGREFLAKWRKDNYSKIEVFVSNFTPSREGQKLLKEKLNEMKWQEAYVKRLIDDIYKAKANAPDNEDFFYDILIEDTNKQLKKIRGDIWKFRHLLLPKGAKFPSGRRQYDIDRIKRVPISHIMGREPARRDSNIDWYHCFMHKDDTPSLAVYNSENRFYCYSCHKSGDVIDAYQLLFNCDFITACESLSLQ